MSESITLASVEGLIRQGRKTLAFPPAVDAQFELDTRRARAKQLSVEARTTIVVYNSFLFCDWILARDTFAIALVLHLLVVTPWMVFVIFLMGRRPGKFVRELAATSISIAFVLQITCIYCLTKSIYASHYFYFVPVTVIYANSVQKLRHAYAVAASAWAAVIFVAALAGARHLPTEVAVMQCFTFAGCIFMTLYSNYYLEGDYRRSYLLSLRDRLRLTEIDAEAKHDALTGLANRHGLDARAAALWRAGDDKSSPIAIILLDVDHFKPFNDLYGHAVGDACLKRVAACMIAELRDADDLAVRYGGEEFLLLLPRTGTPDAVRVAERLRRAIAALNIPHAADERFGIATASFGVAAAPVSAVSLMELVSSADVALYAAKRNGRNQVCPPLLRDEKSAVTPMTSFFSNNMK